MLNPGRTVRANIRLENNGWPCRLIRGTTDIRSTPRSYVAPISARISARISVLRISEREVYCGYLWLHGWFDRDICNFTDIQANIQVDIQTDIQEDTQADIQADIRTDSLTRGTISFDDGKLIIERKMCLVRAKSIYLEHERMGSVDEERLVAFWSWL